MINVDLSKKLNYILKILQMNKKEFLLACQKINPSISKPTILNAINGTNKGFPSLETIDTIIKVCRKSSDNLLKNISYDYLMDESIGNIDQNNVNIGKKLGLSDETLNIIERLPCFEFHFNILDYYIKYVNKDFWEYSQYLIQTIQIQKGLNSLIGFYEVTFEKFDLISIVDLYIDYKKLELNKLKCKNDLDSYKTYLLENLHFKDIFNENISIEDLETSYLQFYKDFSAPLSSLILDLMNNNDIQSKIFIKEDLTNFLNYLNTNYSYNLDGLVDDFYNLLKKLFKTYNWSGIFYKNFIRNNFVSQFEALKNLENIINLIDLYKLNNISLNLETMENINLKLLNLSKLLDSLNKYFRYIISEYVSKTFDNMLKG